MVAFFEAHIERAIAMRARFPRTNGSMLQIFFQNVESSMIHETNHFHHPWIFLGSSAKVGRNPRLEAKSNQTARRRYSWFNFRCEEKVTAFFTGVWAYPIHSFHVSRLLRCRYTSGRSFFKPWGNVGYIFVKTGNLLGCRVCLLILVASYRGLRWLLEQPSGSCFLAIPRFQMVLAMVHATSHVFYKFLR